MIRNISDLGFISLLATPHGEPTKEAVQFRVRVLTFDAAEHVGQLLPVPGLLGEGGGVASLQTRLAVQVSRHYVALSLQYWRFGEIDRARATHCQTAFSEG